MKKTTYIISLVLAVALVLGIATVQSQIGRGDYGYGMGPGYGYGMVRGMMGGSWLATSLTGFILTRQRVI